MSSREQYQVIFDADLMIQELPITPEQFTAAMLIDPDCIRNTWDRIEQSYLLHPGVYHVLENLFLDWMYQCRESVVPAVEYYGVDNEIFGRTQMRVSGRAVTVSREQREHPFIIWIREKCHE